MKYLLAATLSSLWGTYPYVTASTAFLFQQSYHSSLSISFSTQRKQTVNHYESNSFPTSIQPRRKVSRNKCFPLHTSSIQDQDKIDPLTPLGRGEKTAQKAFEALASRNRTWKRLSAFVKLATNNDTISPTAEKTTENPQISIQTIADIGCDHGLLTIALALSQQFQKVYGVDVSQRALQDGALANYQRMIQYVQNNDTNNDSTSLGDVSMTQLDATLKFCAGNGLQPLPSNQIDAICLAGMGIHTMKDILFQPSLLSSTTSSSTLEIDRIGCQHLLVQPTNSKPRNLITLYDSLQSHGWTLQQERIEYLSSRWYITSLFSRHTKADIDEHINNDEATTISLPGDYLKTLKSKSQSHTMYSTYLEYVKHHKQWLQMDATKKSTLCEEDQRWLSSLTD